MTKTWPGVRLVPDPVHHQFELAGNHADNLFVRMLMFGERRARINFDPGMRHAIAVNEARAGRKISAPAGGRCE